MILAKSSIKSRISIYCGERRLADRPRQRESSLGAAGRKNMNNPQFYFENGSLYFHSTVIGLLSSSQAKIECSESSARTPEWRFDGP
jgi:hypothetical protein